MRSTGHVWSYKAICSFVISCFSTALIGAFRSLLFHSVICSRDGPLLHGSLLVLFFDSGHQRFWNFYSSIPVDVVRVKSYVNCLFDPARVVIRVTIDNFHFVPEWLVSGVVGGMFWNGGGLGTGESNASFVLLNSVLHRSSSLSDLHLAAFTGNPVNYAILFSRVDSVFWSHWDLSVVSDLKTALTPCCCRQRRSCSDRTWHQVKPQ